MSSYSSAVQQGLFHRREVKMQEEQKRKPDTDYYRITETHRIAGL